MSTISRQRLLTPPSLRRCLSPLARKRWQEIGSEDAEPPPDFYERDLAGLAEGMRGELADLLGVDEQRLELVSAERPEGFAMRAVYRDGAMGHDYEVSTERHSVTFERVRR